MSPVCIVDGDRASSREHLERPVYVTLDDRMAWSLNRFVEEVGDHEPLAVVSAGVRARAIVML